MTLYDSDFILWTQQQASILRSMPDTQGLDIENLSDEIEGLGRTALADLSNAIRQLLSCLIRRSIDPASLSIEEILSAQSEVIVRSDAGVWRFVDLDKIWRLAKRSVEAGVTNRWQAEDSVFATGKHLRYFALRLFCSQGFELVIVQVHLKPVDLIWCQHCQRNRIPMVR